jgi:hypothetical protein
MLPTGSKVVDFLEIFTEGPSSAQLSQHVGHRVDMDMDGRLGLLLMYENCDEKLCVNARDLTMWVASMKCVMTISA